jgi:pimeloyl-ACP methyl ester carboxylesterase
MSLWTLIKTFFTGKKEEMLLQAGKGLFKSLAGKNKGETIVFREQEGNNNIICFVHGFSGNPSETFGKFPELIKQEKEFDGWDIVSIGYASDTMPTFGFKIWAEQPDITKVAGYLKTNMETLLASYNRVVFVAHSMGGLVVQRALLSLDEKNFDRISHVLLYGTPSGGLHKATLGKWYNIQVRDMDKEGEFIKNLRADWNARFATHIPFYFISVAGELDAFVPVESCHTPFDKKYYAYTTGNHTDMVKPGDSNHTSFHVLKHAVINRKKHMQLFSDGDLNRLLGDYAGILNEFKGKVNTMTKGALREYIFALEGTRELDDAIAILEASNHTKDNTDFIGILAGRYKRKFLDNGLQPDLDKAIELYQKAFTMAESSDKEDKAGQLYYHAINLAFLHLHNEEVGNAKRYAQIALDNALKCKDDHWKYATIAEANLYFDKDDEVKINYTKAIMMGKDKPRDINSMYINAIHGMSKLNKTALKQDVDSLFRG